MSTSKGRGAPAHADGRGRAARAAPVPVPPAPPESARSSSTPTGTDAIPRLFDEFDRLAAATARARRQGRAATGVRRGLPVLPARSRRRRRRRGRPVPIPVRAPRDARPDPRRRRHRGARGRRRGAISTDAELAILEERIVARARGSRRSRRMRPGSSSSRRCRRRPRSSTRLDREFLSAARRARAGPHLDAGPRRPSGAPDGEAWQAAIFDDGDGGRPARPGGPSAALYLAFLGRPNGPRAGWLLAKLDRTSS